jgi:hypothetical protein
MILAIGSVNIKSVYVVLDESLSLVEFGKVKRGYIAPVQ